MVDERKSQAWFEFRIEEIDGIGIETSKLSKLLADMSSAFYAIARAKLGKEAARPGRRTSDEESLAAIRIVRITPGSAILEAEPPSTGLQPQLSLDLNVSAEDVVVDFAAEAQRIAVGEPSGFTRPEVRRRIQDVLRDASEIGATAEVIVRPRFRVIAGKELRVQLSTNVPLEVNDSHNNREPRHRRLSGHAYMVDVEPGKYRIRLKLPDGRDLTLDANEELATILRGAVDRVVEVEAVEEIEGDQVASRHAVDISLLPSSGSGSSKPPKTIDQLAAEQGLSDGVPDYQALATAVWGTDDELEEFANYLRDARMAAS